MDCVNVTPKNINLAITFIDLNDIALDFHSVKDESFKEKLHSSFQRLKDEPNIDERLETFDEVGEGINN